MRVDSIGRCLLGTGGLPGSIDRRPYPFRSDGGGCWVDTDGSPNARILVQLKNPPETLATWRVDGSEMDSTISTKGANQMAGGGGRWIALVVPNGQPLLYGSTIGERPGAGMGDVAFDGTIAFKTKYFGDKGVTIITPAGSEISFPTAVPLEIQALPGGRAIWKGGAGGREPVRPALPTQNLRLATVEDEDWLVYWSEGTGLVAQLDGAFDGYILETRPQAFGHVVWAEGSTLWTAWSTTLGEGPNDLIKRPIDRSAPRVVLVPAEPPFVFPRFAHNVLIAPFAAEGSGCPDIFSLREGGRVIWINDEPAPWTPPASLKPWDLPVIEFYLLLGETILQSAARWRSNTIVLLNAWPGDVGVIPMFYTQNRWTVQQVLDGLRFLNSIVDLSPRIKLIAPFAFDRTNGIKPNPRLLEAFESLKRATPGAPVFTPIEVPPTPPKPPKPLPVPPMPSGLRHKGVSMEYDGKIVVARGFKGMLLRPDAPGTGIWGTIAEPKGTWRGGLFDSVDTNSNECRYRVAKHPSGNGRYTLTNLAHNCLAGEDFGEFTPSINQGFYHKPTGNTDAGDLEQWRIYEGNQNGATEAQCEQVTSQNHPAGEGKKFFCYPLALEVVG